MVETSQFLVLSLPRSRSAWLSHWLGYAGPVGHDLATECSSVAEFKSKFSVLNGSCETGAMLGWRLIVAEMPQTKLAVISREPSQVYDSLRRFGLEPDMEELESRGMMLSQVAKLPGVLALPYSALEDPLACKALWEHCLDLPMDWEWYGKWARVRIEVDMGDRVRWLWDNRDRLAAFKAEVAERSAQLEAPRWMH